MADDQTQRPYRSNEPPVRRAPTATTISGSDPLAELARLIGQSDPFGEFGSDNARRATAPAPASAAPPAAAKFGANDYFGATTAPAAHPPLPEARAYAAPSAARQPYADDDEPETHDHPAAETDSFEQDSYPQSNPHLAGGEGDFYEDVPPPKRRTGIMAIAAVFALAVIGTAGAFGYRAVFGPSRPSAAPPVIKADTAPSKIVPVAASKTPNKLITDRVADHAQDEKIVSREERPVEIKNNAPAAPTPQAQGSAPSAATQPALGNGVIASEAKKVHTIAIRPDQPSSADNQPGMAAAPAPAPIKQAPPPQQTASNPPAAANPSPPAARHATASASNNAPLSLSPGAPAAPAAPMRTASVAAPAAANTTHAAGTYAVQVASQRNEADAQASFRGLQAKYPNQLGGRQVSIHKVDLGAKGTYYRAMVGPFATANEASTLCSGLKAAGGQCIVQRN